MSPDVPDAPAPFPDDRAADARRDDRVVGWWLCSLALLFGLRYLARHGYPVQGLVMCLYNCYFVVLTGVALVAEYRRHRRR